MSKQNEYGFHDQLIPTPKEVVYEMLKDLEMRRHQQYVILEPSAGLGNIAEILDNEHYGKVYCIESNVNSCAVLKEKGLIIIDYDFLKSSPTYSFDYIVMNPPFENGSKHLLHAWEILRKGKIGCLLNKETVSNLFSKERQLLNDIIEKNGQVIDYGKCFKGYNVEVVLVILEKTKVEKPLFDVEFESEDTKINFDVEEENLPAIKDKIGNIVTAYNKVKDLLQDLIRTNNEIDKHINFIMTSNMTINKHKAEMLKDISNYSEIRFKEQAYQEFLELFQNESWESIFKLTQFEGLMTSEVKKQFGETKKSLKNLCFTKENINSLLFAILENSDKILERCILDVFDIFTAYHKENRIHVKGWKTNNQWMVKKRVILPGMVSLWSGRFSDNIYRQSMLQDIDRAMCVVSKTTYSNITPIISILNKCEAGKKNMDSTFFNITCYKALTIHLEFKEKELWEKFNFLVAKERKWIPNNYKESDMKKLLIE